VAGDAHEPRAQPIEAAGIRLVERELLARDRFPVHRVEDQHEHLPAWAARAAQPTTALWRLRPCCSCGRRQRKIGRERAPLQGRELLIELRVYGPVARTGGGGV